MTTSRENVGERQIRALPVIAVCAMATTIAAVVYLGRPRPPARTGSTDTASRRGGEPTPVRDVDHYVPGSPPAVAEAFLRAWMRGRYERARDLATNTMRERCDHEIREVAALDDAQREELRRTRVYVDATNYDLEHIEMVDLPAGANGRARRQVRGQAHATGSFPGTRVDSRRGQTFVLEMVDGAWRVAERTWETFER